jgi:hypothetical protein
LIGRTELPPMSRRRLRPHFHDMGPGSRQPRHPAPRDAPCAVFPGAGERRYLHSRHDAATGRRRPPSSLSRAGTPGDVTQMACHHGPDAPMHPPLPTVSPGGCPSPRPRRCRRPPGNATPKQQRPRRAASHLPRSHRIPFRTPPPAPGQLSGISLVRQTVLTCYQWQRTHSSRSGSRSAAQSHAAHTYYDIHGHMIRFPPWRVRALMEFPPPK